MLRQQARLKSLLSLQVFRVTSVKERLRQQRRHGPTTRSWARDFIAFCLLERREAIGDKLKNCPAYTCEWILREQK